MRIVRPSEVVVDHQSFVAGSRQPVLSATIDEEATRRIVQAPEVVYTDGCEFRSRPAVLCPARRVFGDEEADAHVYVDVVVGDSSETFRRSHRHPTHRGGL